jgi:hypothetical protein
VFGTLGTTVASLVNAYHSTTVLGATAGSTITFVVQLAFQCSELANDYYSTIHSLQSYWESALHSQCGSELIAAANPHNA